MPRTEQEYRTLFEKDPSHLDAFASLRRIYRQQGRDEDLAWLFETRAGRLEGPKAAEMYLRAADIRFQKLGDDEGGIANLMEAMRADPGQRRVSVQLKKRLKEMGRWDEYLETLELELQVVSKDPGRQRRVSALHLEVGTLLEERFGQQDKAMYHYQQAVRADSQNTEALTAARRLYQVMGEWNMVARLLTAEIRVTTHPARRTELLFELGQVLARRLHKLEEAARALQDVLAAQPGHGKAMEVLAEVYSSPDWREPGGLEQAARMYYQVARKYLGEGEQEEAATYLKRALAADPSHAESFRALVDVYEALGQYEDLDALLEQQIQRTRPPERIDLLLRRAQVLDEFLGDKQGARACYEEVMEHEGPRGAAAEFLRDAYLEEGDYEKLALLLEEELEGIRDPQSRVDKMMELAVIYRDHLQDHDKAAVFLHGVLEVEPNNPVALEYYQEHFREKGDYRGLADLIAFAVDTALESSEVTPEVMEKLVELAEIAERRLGDPQWAMDAWQQILDIDPTDQRADEQVRRLDRKIRMWESLKANLERELHAAQTPADRVAALLRMAHAYWDKRMDPVRNIEIVNEVLSYDPANLDALSMLTELYRQEADFEGLANTIKLQLEYVSNKVERVNLLRELAKVSYKELKSHRDVGWACTQILEEVPGDPEAIRLLSTVLEEMEDWPRLVKTLRYHAKAAASDQERLEILRRMARIAAEELNDDVLAAEAWERIMEVEPEDVDALSALTSLYERLGRWAELADVLERRARVLAGEDEETYEAFMRRLARIADRRLGDPDRALEAWQAVAELIPDDKEALGALAKIYYEEEDWEGLCDVIRRQIPLSEDRRKAVGLALRLADILDERLDRPGDAVEVLEDILENIAPDDPDVMARLRKLYVVVGDPAKSVQIAERELDLVDEGPERVRLGLEVAAAWRDEVGDDDQAILAYERVLHEDPTCREALSALVVLYTRTGQWEKLIETNQLLFDFADNDRERLRLLYQIAEVYEERLDEPTEAFAWYRRAFELFPEDRGTLTSLERAAAEHELWEPLIEVYEQVRARAQHPSQHLEAASKIAQIYEQELGDGAKAFEVLRGALVVDLTGEEFLPELERLASDLERWDDLVEIYEKVLRHQPTGEAKVQLFHKCASILEDELGDKKGALDRLRRAFDIDQTDLTTLDRMLALGEELESWNDVLAVYGAQYSLSGSLEERIDLVKKSAQIMENQVGDKVKAFRAYLHGFLIDPEDDDLLVEIWRLAREIGDYSPEVLEQDSRATDAARKARRRTREKKDRARMSPSSLASGAVSMDGSRMMGGPSRMDVTQELDISDLEFVEEDAGSGDAFRLDPTQQVGLSAALEIHSVKTGEVPLVEMDREFQLLEKVAGAREAAREYIEEEVTGGHELVSYVGPDLPPATSAWEEFARAYALLPAPDQETKRERCHRIAEIWRDGAEQLDRAFEALRWALEMDVTDEGTRQAIEEVARQAGMLEDLAEVYVNILAESHGVDRLVFLHSEIARLFEDVGLMDRAEHHYRAILSIKPEWKPAFERLCEIYRTTERWQDLAALEERQMEDLLDQLPVGPEREEKLRELARLYEDKLDQPYEAMDAWNKVLGMVSDDLEAYRSLARLGAKTGSWSKAVDALARIQELTDDEDEALSVRRQMARIYHRELELPDRAIEAYRAILSINPEDDEALLSLDTLYETHESWDELDEILQLRASLAQDDEERSEFIVRRAKLLEEHLGDYHAAAQCYEQLRQIAPDNLEYWDESVRLLRESGRSEEALDVLQERLDRARSVGLPSGDLAALLVRQATLAGRELGELDRARSLLEEALELVPDYPSAIAELARLHKDEEDWPAYAQARMKEAEVAEDLDSAVTALVEAGRVFQEKLGDISRASECFAAAIKKAPDSVEALQAAADLARSRQDWDELLRLLGRLSELVESPERKADLLTELSDVTRKSGGSTDDAKKLLHQALDVQRDHVQAVIALADIFYEEGASTEAKDLLEEALRRLEGQPKLAARLGYRLAKLYEELGEDEGVYKFLREIDRKNPNQLLLKLALGENRFRARRWREVAKLLSALPDHPDALEYPDEVARACCLAAQAEIHLRRPAKAYPLYETALQFVPDYLEAINALVKYHTDRGALDDAAKYLRAQAEAMSEPSSKVALWDSLGDLYRDQLEDDEAALECYLAALDAAEPIDRQHVPILEKVFPLCRALGRDEDAARIIGFTLAFTEDPEQRAPRLVQAADAAVALDEMDRAVAFLREALDIDPLDEAALLGLVDVYEQLGRFRDAADHLSEFLSRTEEVEIEDSEEWSRQAALYERLANIYKEGLEDPRQAIEVFEKALELDPTRLSCRRKLSELYGDNPEYEERAFYTHQALLADDVRRHESLVAMGRILRRRNEVDKALCVIRALEVEGRADLDDLGYVAQHGPKPLGVSERWPGSLDDDDHISLLAHPNTKVMGEIFATIWEGAPALFGGGLERLGLSAQDRISPVADLDIAKVYSASARALGNRLTGLYGAWTGQYHGIAIACHAPPVVVAGPEVEEMPVAELRFRLGRALELTRPEYILSAGLEPEEFTALFAAVLRAFHPRHARRKLEESDPIALRALQLKKDLPYRVSRKLVSLFQAKAHVEFNSAGWRQAVQMTGNRAGLLVCDDLKAAVSVILAEDLGVASDATWTPDEFDEYLEQSLFLRDLMAYSVSEEYFQARKRLGQSVVTEEVS